MQNKKLTRRDKWKLLLEKFIPYEGYEPDNYYGVSVIKTKKESVYRLKLIHDYTSRALMSQNQVEFKDRKTMFAAYEILDDFAKSGEVVRDNMDFLDEEDESDVIERSDDAKEDEVPEW